VGHPVKHLRDRRSHTTVARDRLFGYAAAFTVGWRRMPMTDNRLYAPATLRNRDPILSVLRDVLPSTGTVLEVASGSGEHIVHFARHLPGLIFQPSDPDAEALRSIRAWVLDAGVTNVLPPLLIDASAASWPITSADAVLCINMVHIAPWSATEGLIGGAARLLPPDGPLYLYGPYRQQGVPFAPSNEGFDQSLRAHDPSWGVRALEDVAAAAAAAGFGEAVVTPMPANNLSVVFRKR
jgi:SAM-dependent methyltransferase